MEKRVVKLRINNQENDLEIYDNETLLEVLRQRLGLTGTKEGCEDGTCGACTVLINGDPVRSCLILALEAENKDIVTIEGLSQGEELNPIQEAFIEHGGVQCGFCTPGMVLTAKALLEKNPKPTKTEIKEAISGNLCRCTGYTKIIDSIMAAATKGKKDGS